MTPEDLTPLLEEPLEIRQEVDQQDWLASAIGLDCIPAIDQRAIGIKAIQDSFFSFLHRLGIANFWHT